MGKLNKMAGISSAITYFSPTKLAPPVPHMGARRTKREQQFSISQRASDMTTTFFAQPYNTSAVGFYFSSTAEFAAKSASHIDCYGNTVEEYEIQLNEADDAELINALQLDQSSVAQYFDEIEDMSASEKVALFYLVHEANYCLNDAIAKIDEVCITTCSLKDAAAELFDECYLTSIPDAVRNYIDYDSLARDCELNGDLAEFRFGSDTYTVTNASCI
ncbi:antirestriction protein ArdA [Deefgea tanakiae]|uniref:Antirestriction protein ArdA n=1 Tax=Deefgea tanakiae TaxID=2865840 RepID=A0ABX8Z6J4_9NEIS|nr:antirestriction protein ArdA [Deefgea tanakiae]QZA78207.1 antirestriction protein ArdA [Deefgea tanakiae]